CGAVCPSGAIENFSVKDKTHLVIGLAVIDQANCLLAQNKECDLCKTYCPYAAIAIKESEFDFSSYPDVNLDLCVGCGACEIICPVHVIEIVPEEQVNNP
ncbi:4Fe-4S dicluster domain-containing protein, partial [bacterium]|nr:4Fe-4S dicluster domain-containing protein [bacterium]